VSGLCRQQQSVDLKALIAKLQEELRTRVDEIAVFGQTVQTTIPLGPERDAALKKDFERKRSRLIVLHRRFYGRLETRSSDGPHLPSLESHLPSGAHRQIL
jgi:hypothetical protein